MSNPRINSRTLSNKNKSVITKDITLNQNEKKKEDKNNLNSSNDVILEEIEKIWHLIDHEINFNTYWYNLINKGKKSNLNQIKRFKTIRVFVSSTFTDFFNEREVLVKNVFPELREWCFKRNLDLIECDLRWGVPVDSTSDDTILTCLSELDRCYKENDGQPFFIGMLGEKYGWVPSMDKLSDKIKNTYNWVPKCSITFMEFLHGSFRSKNKNSCFFIRTKESLDNIPVEFHEKFYETNEFSQLQLKVLKHKLKYYNPGRVFDYSCKYDSIDDQTGRKKVKLVGLEEFGQKALDFLKNAIENFYPDLKPIQNIKLDEHTKLQHISNDLILNDEQITQDLYISEKTNFLIGFSNEINTILNFIYNNDLASKSSFDLIKNMQSEDDLDEINRPLLILGDEGSGKSTLLATIAKLLLEKKENVFYHFYDASVLSQYSRILLSRFIYKYKKELNIEDELEFEIENDDEKTIFSFNQIFDCMNKNEKLILLIDGYDYEHQHWFDWIPRDLSKFNNKLKIIFTCTYNNTKVIDYLINSKSWYKYELNNLNDKLSREFIEKYLLKYNKRLDQKQMNLILNKSNENKSPLWLSFICNELRIFGEFTTINKKIENLPFDLNSLLKNILNRINTDFENNIVKEILCLIAVSENGLPENEICLVIGHELNRLKLAQINRSLKMFLKYSNFHSTHLIAVNNKKFKDIIFENYLDNNSEKIEDYNNKLIEFYLNTSKYRSYACMELCYHFRYLPDKKKKFFEFLISNEAQSELNNSYRSFLINELRCKFMVIKNETNCVKMCQPCSNKKNNLSLYHLNKNSCYICGSYFVFDNKELYRCNLHNFNQSGLNNFFKCSICNQFIFEDNQYLKAVKAKSCAFCNSDFCCKFCFE